MHCYRKKSKVNQEELATSEASMGFQGLSPKRQLGNSERSQMWHSVQFKKYIQTDQIQLPSSPPGEAQIRTSRRAYLGELVKRNKVKKLVANFISKLKRSIAFRRPSNQNPDDIQVKEMKGIQGLCIRHQYLALFNLVSIILSLSIFIMYTIFLIFPEAQNTQQSTAIKTGATIFFFCEIIWQFFIKKNSQGKTLNSVREISQDYFKSTFTIDLVNLLTLIISLTSKQENDFFRILRLLTAIKSFQYSQKVEVLEKLFFSNFKRQQYLQLLSTLAINLCLAHVLSIALNAMAMLNPGHNWLTNKGIAECPWYQRYIWGYYWGTTVMLTVGFGDLAATNLEEALCLTFIELISCMALSYNINCLGNILANLRTYHLEKRSNIKTFGSMVKTNDISEELQNRVQSFIQGNSLIKEQFNFHEQDQLLDKIPKSLRIEYLREANIQILKNIQVIKNFTFKTKRLLAQAIVKKVAHPEQLLILKGDELKLMILKKGQIGFSIRHYSQPNCSVLLNTVRVDKKENPKLITLGFIKADVSTCDVRSLAYSILYEFKKEEVIEILKQSRYDYEHYCMIRDKSQCILGQNQPFPCKQCQDQSHLKLTCPKLHYIPLREHVVHKYLRRVAIACNSRKFYPRDRQYIMALKLKDFHRYELEEYKQQNCCQETGSKSSISKLNQLNYQDTNFVTGQNKTKILNFIPEYVRQITNCNENQTDLMHDWQYYFTDFNAANLYRRLHSKKKYFRKSI